MILSETLGHLTGGVIVSIAHPKGMGIRAEFQTRDRLLLRVEDREVHEGLRRHHGGILEGHGERRL